MKKIVVPGLFVVYHEQYCTDHYESGDTIVKADSPKEAMDKLNAYLATEPDGGYTALPCKSVNDVYELTVLS